MLHAMLRVVKVAGDSAQDADQLLVSAIEEARGHGATWKDIGEALGINQEAARKRYGWRTSS
jgi:hypothetical protein